MQSNHGRNWGGPMLDAHAHLGRSLFGAEITVDELIASMETNGISRSVLVPLKPVNYHFGPENDRIAAAASRYPDRFSGLARVDPWQNTGALTELKRAVDDLDLIGLYLHPFEEHFTANDEVIFPLLDFLQERGLPLLLAGGYPGFSHPSQIGDLARQFPDVTIIASHGGQLNISGMLLADASRMLRTYNNVIMETSGIYREDFIEDIVKELGAERVVFGSNAPYMDQGYETLRVRLAHLSDEDKQCIATSNLARILGEKRLSQ